MEELVHVDCLRCHSPMQFLGKRSYQSWHESLLSTTDSFILYRCPGCGKVEFFEFVVDNTECLACGETIRVGQAACLRCGWTWEPPAEPPAPR